MTDVQKDHKAPPAKEPLDMHDPADRDLHTDTDEGAAPFKAPAKTKVVGKPQDDTVDPAAKDDDAPHDRGTMRDGKYERGIESMRRSVDDDKAWREGKTQN